MLLKPEQLPAALKRGLTPVGLVAGDDPLRVQECVAQVRAAALAAGYDERVRYTVERGFDWAALRGELGTASLFAARRLVELDIGEGKIGAPGSSALTAWLAEPPDDLILLVTGSAFDRQVRDSAWFQAIAQRALVVYAWPLSQTEMPRWLRARAQTLGLGLSEAAATLLAQWGEGNLIAAAQELDKLALLHPQGSHLDTEQVIDAGGDSARYELQALTGAVLDGDANAALRVLQRLREEGLEAPLVLWALAAAARALAGGAALRGPATVKHQVQLASRRAPVGYWRQLLVRAATVDRVIKGAATGDPWLALADLARRFTPPAGGSPAPPSRNAVPR